MRKKAKTLKSLFDIFRKKQGTHGRLEIPSLRISIPLNDAKGNAQEIVDARQSAAYIHWNGQDAIADHSGQDGFERLAKAEPMATLAYIDYQGRRDTYLCTKKQVGHIQLGEKNKIVDAEWKPVKSGGIAMYTCIGKSAKDVMDVWLTYWKKI